MRPSALRALLFALALVVQTVSGGASMAAAGASMADRAAVSEHCKQMGHAAPVAPAKHHQNGDCSDCAALFASSDGLVAQFVEWRDTPRDGVYAQSPDALSRLPEPPENDARRARAPPTA